MAKNASTSAGFAADVVKTVVALLAQCLPCSTRPQLIGMTGLQGSGKSTLARQLCAAAAAQGIHAQMLSLDDVYLCREQRQALAQKIHPLLANRGVPGTHDLSLLHDVIDQLAHADVQPVQLPRFDKGSDSRLPRAVWPWVRRTPQWLFLEGWCVAVPPEPDQALRQPLNDLEREHDADGRWRRWVNTQLATNYVPLWQRLDHLVWLAAADFGLVRRWRGQAEQELRARAAPRAMKAAQLEYFIKHFERLSRHSLHSLPARAQLRLDLDGQRRILAISSSRKASGRDSAYFAAFG